MKLACKRLISIFEMFFLIFIGLFGQNDISEPWEKGLNTLSVHSDLMRNKMEVVSFGCYIK